MGQTVAIINQPTDRPTDQPSTAARFPHTMQQHNCKLEFNNEIYSILSNVIVVVDIKHRQENFYLVRFLRCHPIRSWSWSSSNLLIKWGEQRRWVCLRPIRNNSALLSVLQHCIRATTFFILSFRSIILIIITQEDEQ